MPIVTTESLLRKAPATIHLLITSHCNLNCKGCYYKSADVEIPLPILRELFGEWARSGVKAVAIGGGEPFLYPGINEVMEIGKRLGFYLAVTTNGTVLPRLEIPPDRVHVSYDEIHATSKDDVREAMQHFRRCGVKSVGLNHIVTSLRAMGEALSMPCDEITLLLEKPQPEFNDWVELFQLTDID